MNDSASGGSVLRRWRFSVGPRLPPAVPRAALPERGRGPRPRAAVPPPKRLGTCLTDLRRPGGVVKKFENSDGKAEGRTFPLEVAVTSKSCRLLMQTVET